MKINYIEIIQQTSIKFLGITIDQNLNWKEYTEILTNKIAKNMNIIKHIKKFINQKALQSLYFTMIHSYLTYCNIIWGSNYKTLIEKIQISQNKAIRLTFNDRRYTSTKSYYEINKILKIVNIHKSQTAIFIFKYLNKLLPQYFHIKNYFTNWNELHNYNTRNSNSIYLPYASTNYRMFTIKYFGPRIWNTIPNNIANEDKLTRFKNKLKIYLLSIQNEKPSCLSHVSLKLTFLLNEP